jgi:exportin-5
VELLIIYLFRLIFEENILLFYEQIVNRKGRVEERMPLLVLFSADVMSCIFKAADAASSKSLDERHYNFLKRLTLVSGS